MAKGYKRYTLHQAMKMIDDGGLRGLTMDELRSVGRPIMTETKKKLKELRDAGYKKSPAYSAYKSLGLNTSTSTENRNKLLAEVYNAYTFLMAKTSSVQGVQNYMDRASQTFGRTVTMEEANLIWAALDIMRKEQPEMFEQFSYNITIEEVAFQGSQLFEKSGKKSSARDVVEMAKEILARNAAEGIDADDDLFSFDDSEFWTGRIL